MAPQFFENEQVNADLFVMTPRSADRWSALLAVEVQLGSDTFILEEETWELRVLVRKMNGTILHSFRREVSMPASSLDGGAPPAATLFEEIRIRPGKYLISALLAAPDGDAPLAATRPAVVSEVPLDKPFMIGPMLDNRPIVETASTDLATLPRPEFEPLLEQVTERGADLESLTVVCVVAPE